MKLNLSNASLRICVNEVVKGRISGMVFSQRLREPMPFSDIASLLLQVEELLDEQDFPRAFQRKRQFPAKQGARPERGRAWRPPGELPEDESRPYMALEAVEAAKGAIATFVIYIITRQNTSWQGKVDWLDGTEERFSSALELIYLIDERVAR